jgi:two-component system, cell cycle response regulator
MEMQQIVSLIDDSIPNHKLVSPRFKPARLRVVSAYGVEAGRASVKGSPDLILLALDIPNFYGFEFCRRLKSHPATAAIRVTFLTGNTDFYNMIGGLDKRGPNRAQVADEPEEIVKTV